MDSVGASLVMQLFLSLHVRYKICHRHSGLDPESTTQIADKLVLLWILNQVQDDDKRYFLEGLIIFPAVQGCGSRVGAWDDREK